MTLNNSHQTKILIYFEYTFLIKNYKINTNEKLYYILIFDTKLSIINPEDNVTIAIPLLD